MIVGYAVGESIKGHALERLLVLIISAMIFSNGDGIANIFNHFVIPFRFYKGFYNNSPRAIL